MIRQLQLTRRRCLGGIVGGIALGLGGCARRGDGVRIGFVVKQPEAQWFQDEWRFAEAAARLKDFRLFRIGAEDGDRVLSALNTLYSRYAQGLVICAPDPRLGPAIAQFAADTGIKVMSVDDRLIAANGAPIENIPHVGISAVAIGKLAGEAAAAEAKRRGWNPAETGILRIAFDSLETGRERTMGARDALIAAGHPPARVFTAPQRTSDTEGAFTAADPVLTGRASIKRWIILGLNDETVLGGVRAAEGLGLGADNIIGVGIGGSEAAVADFEKPSPTGLYASVLLSPRRHGFDTTVAMYDWIVNGRRPAPVTYTSGILMTRANYRALLAAEAA